MSSTTDELNLTAIGQIYVRTRDLARATAFYREVLGLRFLFEAPPSMAFFTCGDVRLMLGPAEGPEFDHPASILYYRVADITAAHDVLVSRGVAVVHVPRAVHRTETFVLWLAFYHDSEENVFALMSEVAP